MFEALARGFSRYNDILSQSHVSSGPTLVDVLDKLIKMEVVKKEAPLNDENNRKKAGYYISDNLSLFYYKYIFRYLSQLSLMEPETFFDRYISRDFETDTCPAFSKTSAGSIWFAETVGDKWTFPSRKSVVTITMIPKAE